MPGNNNFIKRGTTQDAVFGILICLSYFVCSMIGLYQGEYEVFWLFLILAACCFILLDLHTRCRNLWINWKKKRQP